MGAFVAAALAIAVLDPVKVGFNSAGASTSVAYVNGYPTINGNYVDCDGNVDNDMGHHVANPADTDPAHHIGQNCPSGSFVANAAAPAGAAITTQAVNLISATLTAVPAGAQTAAQTTGGIQPGSITQSASKSVDVWWPADGSAISGLTPFKALLKQASVTTYNMFWQVDGGSLNGMGNNYNGYPHKESMVDVSGWNWKGSGPYAITFIAKDFFGTVLGQTSVSVTVTGQTQTASAPLAPALTSTPTPTASGNPFAGARLYVNPNSNAVQQADAWRGSYPYGAQMMDKVAQGAESKWMGGWSGNVQSDVNNYVSTVSNTGSLPVMIAYNIPNRDCGGYSQGGASTVSDYQNWVKAFAAGIGSRKAAIILEPDAVALTSCLSATELQQRYSMLQFAVSTFKSLGNTAVYIDAGHANWIPASQIATALQNAGISSADGFALNTSNFTTTSDNLTYGQAISSQVGGKHYVLDTGRNGRGPDSSYQWCNPPGRGLGNLPAVSTGNSLADAFLWLKAPGESDGTCNGGPAAGAWWPSYAVGLAQNASW